ncbi:MAG: SusC/RagA family TonB-linked outer membrane protein, partial [Bacteroidetes bacterium]
MRKLILLFFLTLLITTVNAQEKLSISGKVIDNTGLGLPGVSILEKGTTNGTVTNVNGDYSLQVMPQSTLIFSFIGFVTQEIPVGNKTTIDVEMIESIVGLDEVIVVGYGKMVVKDLTSSISTVKADELVKSPSGQAMQALQGKVAGLQVVSSGAPGDAPTIRVRGIGSYPGRNNEAPLYVVDGIFYDNIDFLNTADISSISVLKDASAAAIYGVRAANGVVLIETKSGGYEQDAEISYDGYYGTQVAQNVLKMANAEQFTAMAMESGSAADASFILNAMQKYGRSRVNPNVPDVNTDWYKEILRPAPIQNHSLNVTGGSKQASYSIGTNYFAQDGILDMKNQYERFNLRSKIDYKAAKWLTIGGNMVFSNALKYNDEAGAWNQAYFAVPILPIRDESNTAAWPEPWANAQDLGYRGGQNPFPTLSYNENQLKIKKLLTNFYAQLEIIPDKLSFKTSYSHAFTSLDERNANLPYYLGDGFQRPDATLTKRMSNFSNQTIDNVLTYTDRFDEHRFIVMAGHSYRDEAYHGLSAQGLNFPYEQDQAWYIDQAETIPPTGVSNDGLRQYGISYFGRLSYNFGDKYLLYATMRADG